MRRLILPVLAGALLAGCGSTAGTAGTLQPAAGGALAPIVTSVAQAARAGDRTTTAAAVTRLQQELAAQQAAGRVSPDRAAAVLSAAERVLADLAVSGSPAGQQSAAPGSTSGSTSATTSNPPASKDAPQASSPAAQSQPQPAGDTGPGKKEKDKKGEQGNSDKGKGH